MGRQSLSFKTIDNPHTREPPMFSLKHLFVVAGLVGLTACAPAAPPPVDTAADEAALKAATTTWIDAYNAGEVEKIVALYAEDGVLMPPHAASAYGHGAIQTFLAADTAGAKAAGVKIVNGASTAGVVGDWGWESGSFTIVDATGTAVDSGSYLSTSRKVDGKWLFVRDMYNSDRPIPAAAAPSAAAAK